MNDNFSALKLSLEQAILRLVAGGIVIYPTETFYAIGCLADKSSAMDIIARLKRRPDGKTFSLLAGSMALVNMAADITQAPPSLLSDFWPGPLTLILPARGDPPAPIRDARDKIAIRFTSHHLAQKLSLGCQSPLVATSANISGCAPVFRHQDLDPRLLEGMKNSGLPSGILYGKDEIFHGLPSTIMEPIAKSPGLWQLKLVREGAIDKNAPGMENFDIYS